MRCSLVLAVLVAVLTPSTSAALQTAEDTLPERVVDRAIKAFMRHDAEAYIAEWDSVTYFQDLEPSQVSAAHPGAPSQRRHAEFARRLREAWGRPDPRGRGRVELIQRLVAGRFVVNHLAMSWEPPHDTQNFQKLEIYEVRNGKIVAEYDGQYVASGRSATAGRPQGARTAPPKPRMQPTGRMGAGLRAGGTSR